MVTTQCHVVTVANLRCVFGCRRTRRWGYVARFYGTRSLISRSFLLISSLLRATSPSQCLSTYEATSLAVTDIRAILSLCTHHRTCRNFGAERQIMSKRERNLVEDLFLRFSTSDLFETIKLTDDQVTVVYQYLCLVEIPTRNSDLLSRLALSSLL